MYANGIAGLTIGLAFVMCLGLLMILFVTILNWMLSK